MIAQAAEIVWQSGSVAHRVAVVVPLYNYEGYIAETLDSVAKQTMRDVTLVVVNDCSTDNSLKAAAEWMHRNRDTDIGMVLLNHDENAGVSIARNTGIAMVAEAEFCFMLDADNLLYPRCIEKLVAALDARPDAAVAYSLIEVFGGERDLLGAGVFVKEGLKHGNFIDVMALYRRQTLLDLNGFEKIRYGWEDYDLWLRMIARGRIALHLPEITSRYRHHRASMIRTQQPPKNLKELRRNMTRRHAWLDLK